VEWVETTGRTVEEALEAAADQLGVHEEDVEYEVLVEPKAGLFGRFGGSEARLRARVKPLSREKPGERRRRKSRNGGGGNGRSEAPGRGARTRGVRSERTGSGRDRPARSTGRPSANEPSADGRAEGGRSRPRRRPATETRVSEGATMEEQVPVPIEEQAATAEAFTRGLVEAFGARAEVRSTIEEDTVLVEVEGDGLGLLVGPRGATLTAVEELTRTVVQRSTGGHGARINVDVGGYRAKRREALAAFTRQLVDRVLETGREQVLDPMPASDRKVVHDVAAEIEGVETASEGEEPRRRVVIRRV